MMQVIKQTDKEKMAMYMKMPKKKIAEMLIQCNKVLDTQYGAKVFSSNAVLSVSLTFEQRQCPVCKTNINVEDNYCSGCGQKFKWQ